MALYKKIFYYCLIVGALAACVHPALVAQTAAGSQIIGQGRIVFNYKSFPAETLKTNIVSFQVIGVPCYLTLAADPKFVFGQADEDSSTVTAAVQDTTHAPISYGVAVTFTTDLGTFSNGLQTITVTSVDGNAVTSLHSATVQNDKKTATITATVHKATGDLLTATTQAIMYPGAVTGVVLNGALQQPLKGAIAIVSDQDGAFVGADTTHEDGVFFIPLNKRVTVYHLQIIVTDSHGDTLVSSSNIDATKFPLPAVRIPNVIAGRIEYNQNGVALPAPGVRVYLDSASQSPSTRLHGPTTAGVSYLRVQEQLSDEKGRFKFENLLPAVYRLSIDSAIIQNSSVQKILADTASGTFTINLNIDIPIDSLVTLRMDGRKTASAGDTLRYSITAVNAGNLVRRNATLIDTLPQQTRFVSSAKGTFVTTSYDSLSRTVRWTIDSLKAGAADSATVAFEILRNLTDSTVITNTVWYTAPGERPKFYASSSALVRSVGTPMFSSYFAGHDSIAAGDSVMKVYAYGNIGTDSLRSMSIVDTLHGAGRSIFALSKNSATGRVTMKDSIITIAIGSVAPGASDTVSVSIATDKSLPPGSKIVSNTRLLKAGAAIDSVVSTLGIMQKLNGAALLKVVKTANKKIAEVGDIVTYQVQVTSTYNGPLLHMGLYDLLPHAFTYVKNSARWNNKPLEPSAIQMTTGLTWTPADTLAANSTGVLVYQLALGADALESQGINAVTASAETRDGIRLVSDPSQIQVTVKPGVFTEKGLVIGKVFYDDDRNTFQDEGENGIKDVELWMEDGTRIITGDDGKFSVPELKPGDHVLRVNERTLPPGSQLLGGTKDFAGDPVSRFVHVTESGIAKANFFVKRSLRDTVGLTVVRSLRSSAMRQAVPKYIFKGDSNSLSADTVEMIVSFTYKGDKYLQRIEVNELLPDGFTYVDKSGRFNTRTFDPVIHGDSLLWTLGRGGAAFTGTLRYKAVVSSWPEPLANLSTSSVIALMTADSVMLVSAPLITHNIVKPVVTNAVDSTDVLETFVPPAFSAAHADTAVVSKGDELTVAGIVRIDPHRRLQSVIFIDTVTSHFALNDRSFTLNGIPIASERLTIGSTPNHSEVNLRIISIDLTGLLKSGRNMLTYTERVGYAGADTTLAAKNYVSMADAVNGRINVPSQNAYIMLKNSGTQPRTIATPVVALASASAVVKPVVASAPTETPVKPSVPITKPKTEPVTVKPEVHIAPIAEEHPSTIVRHDTITAAPSMTTPWFIYKRIDGTFMVQVSSWNGKAKAIGEAEKFTHAYGIQTVLYEHLLNGRTYFAVQFGPFASANEAKNAIIRLLGGDSTQDRKQTQRVKPSVSPAKDSLSVMKSSTRSVGKTVTMANEKSALQTAAPSAAHAAPEWIVYKNPDAGYMVQISAWDTKAKAQAQANRFTQQYKQQTCLQEHVKNGKTYFAVQFGPYKTSIEARAAIDLCLGAASKNIQPTSLAGVPEKMH